jgi:hypothetical protein
MLPQNSSGRAQLRLGSAASVLATAAATVLSPPASSLASLFSAKDYISSSPTGALEDDGPGYVLSFLCIGPFNTTVLFMP